MDATAPTPDARTVITERPAWHRGAGAAIGALAGSLILVAVAVLVLIAAVAADLPALVAITVIAALLAVVPATMVTVLDPGHTSVVQIFGRYLGTLRHPGLNLVPPFTTRTKMSVRVHNFETAELKVNDADGNPVNIAAIVVWQVADTARARFSVEDYEEFIASQAESALRHVSTTHPYDTDDANPEATSLRGSTDVVAAELTEKVADRVQLAGLEIIETRISSLAYAPEIAQAMLQRQQASALLAAREKIVEGAVSLVENALARLEANSVVELDAAQRASMVSNLLVVLCSDSRATPVINAGGSAS